MPRVAGAGKIVHADVVSDTGTSFSAAYRLGNAIGLVIYEIKSDGTLEGLWTIADKSGVGAEILTPRR